MSFISGSTALTICKLSAKLPEDYLNRLAAQALCKLDDVKDEPAYGWAGYAHSQAPIDEAEAILGGHLCIQLVKAERKIPSATFQDACRRQEQAYMLANNGRTPAGKDRKRIKEEVRERLLMKCPVTLSSIPVAVDLSSMTLYAGTASPHQLGNVIALFHKSLGVEPRPFSVNELMELMNGKESDLPVLSLGGRAIEEPTPARDFLTWLWYFAEEKGAKIDVPLNGDFEAMVEGPLVLAAQEAKGAAESAVKKGGCPTVSAEAKAALLPGKKLKKATLAIACGKQVWRGTFDADKFAFSGLNLPEGEEMEKNARFEERMEAFHSLTEALKTYFIDFSAIMRSEAKTKTEQAMRKWVQDREGI